MKIRITQRRDGSRVVQASRQTGKQLHFIGQKQAKSRPEVALAIEELYNEAKKGDKPTFEGHGKTGIREVA